MYSEQFKLKIYAYCLMTNHVHFIAVPEKPESLAMTFKYAHMRYSNYFNKKNKSSGHLWQGRFYSCALDDSHAVAAVRYVERNPVRALMVDLPWEYEWSSSGEHTGMRMREKGDSPQMEMVPGKIGQTPGARQSQFSQVRDPEQVHIGMTDKRNIFPHLYDLGDLGFDWSPDGWKEYLGNGDEEEFLNKIRKNTLSGLPVFNDKNLDEAEKKLGVILKRNPRGRPRKEK